MKQQGVLGSATFAAFGVALGTFWVTSKLIKGFCDSILFQPDFSVFLTSALTAALTATGSFPFAIYVLSDKSQFPIQKFDKILILSAMFWVILWSGHLFVYGDVCSKVELRAYGASLIIPISIMALISFGRHWTTNND